MTDEQRLTLINRLLAEYRHELDELSDSELLAHIKTNVMYANLFKEPGD